MAIYGDDKHNENMEYNAPRFKVTDRVVYKTIHWTVETEHDAYNVQCQENDFDETWYISSDGEGSIDNDSELGQQIIDVCTDYEVFDADKNE